MTYAPPKMQTDHEVFLFVKAHLTAMTEPSIDPEKQISDKGNPYCCYRSPKGLMCAVGCLIADKNYSELIENEPGSSSAVMERVWDSIECSPDYGMVQRLQQIHDDYFVELEERLDEEKWQFDANGRYHGPGYENGYDEEDM